MKPCPHGQTMQNETTLSKKRTDMARKPLHECHGGKGALDWTLIVGRDELHGRHLNFVHDDVLEPGVSIGRHLHHTDEEYYLVVEGHGTMTLDDRRIPVGPGDMTGVFPGGSHSLENTGTTNLRVLVISVRASNEASL